MLVFMSFQIVRGRSLVAIDAKIPKDQRVLKAGGAFPVTLTEDHLKHKINIFSRSLHLLGQNSDHPH